MNTNDTNHEPTNTQRALSRSEHVAQWEQRAYTTDRHKQALERLLVESHDMIEGLAMESARKEDQIEELRAILQEKEEQLLRLAEAIPFAMLNNLADPARWSGGTLIDLSRSIQSESARAITAIREALK